MQIQKCTLEDAALLSQMNKRLIDDEKSTNPMTVEELEERMRGFLSTDYSAYFFMQDETVVGYALVKDTEKPLYLRQFFIDREYRRQHLGRQAFHLLLDFLKTDTINLDVLPWNEPGLRFWQSLGFAPTCISMQYKGKDVRDIK
ncbi:MAG: GNAT family N-acetyltransferase [Spirochaetaceae bacterium]|nr:GNAT family N-acetyltransferase [Spirochaetaceae bacterium]